MCGFFFYTSVNSIKQSKSEIVEIKNNLKKRGPDKFRYIEKKNFSMFFSRLSILDPSRKSDQPFTDNKKKYFLVFNGEIYNYLELKKQLINEGINFKTNSDTEVLFKLLISKGINKTLKIIQGMFSFIFYDIKKNKIYGARDHFGQKPFYYHKSNTEFLASTNIHPILKKIKNQDKDLNINTLQQYLCSSGIIPLNKTFFKGISSLQAGSFITIHKGKATIKKYFRPIDLFHKKKYLEFKNTSEQNILKILDKKIKKAVERHLISDVNLAVTCSGGIDSSLVTSYVTEKDKTMSVLTNTSEGIESSSKIVPKILKKNKVTNKRAHFIKQNKNEYFNGLSKLVQNNLAPARWGGGPPMKSLCEYARKNKIKVLLGGDGVDEYFCGYNSFYNSLYKKYEYGLHSILTLDKKFGIKKNLADDFYMKILESKKIISKKINFIKDKKEKKIITNTFLDTEFFLQNCTLPHSDEYSMQESVEMRNPFLDIDLVEFCLNLPGKFKISKNNRFKNKYLIRKLASNKYGKFIDKEKEGTRNYSKFISNKKFWNFDNFQILRIIKMTNKPSYKEIFKIINLEILLRSTLTKNFNYFTDIVSKEGLKNLI